LLHPIHIIKICTCAREDEEKEKDNESDNLPFAFLPYRLLVLLLFLGRWGRRVAYGFQFAPAFRTRRLCLETIVAAAGAPTKLTCDARAAMRTSAGHRGDLLATNGTFDDAHLSYSL
jgi:hypothetical protein